VNESAAAAAEQSTGVEQVNTAMTQMDRITQANAAQTEQLSSTAQAMSEQAQRLMELVGTFVLGQGGASAHALPAARRSAVVRHPPPAKPSPRARTVVTAKNKPRAASVEPRGTLRTALTVAGSHDDASFEEF
jgi:methyl-accepting chemotaxis protein